MKKKLTGKMLADAVGMGRLYDAAEENERRGLEESRKGQNRYAVTERQLRTIIREAIENAVEQLGEEEETFENYNPWMNGNASYFNHTFDLGNSTVEINTGLSYVSVDYKDNEDDGYFFQGDEADDIIKEICWYWNMHNCSQDEAVKAIVSSF